MTSCMMHQIREGFQTTVTEKKGEGVGDGDYSPFPLRPRNFSLPFLNPSLIFVWSGREGRSPLRKTSSMLCTRLIVNHYFTTESSTYRTFDAQDFCFRWSRAMPSSLPPPSTWPTTEQQADFLCMTCNTAATAFKICWRLLSFWKYWNVLTQDFIIHPTCLASLESSIESYKTVKNVIPVLLKAAVDQSVLNEMRPGRQFVVKSQLLQKR